MGKAPVGPSHLTKVLKVLKAEPKLSLSGVRTLKLSYAFRNDHFGARHFAKEELPRIKYANPNLQVEVEKVIKTKEDHWRPEMELHFNNGAVKAIDMHDKWSTTILHELLETSGGEPWRRWKASASKSGVPLFPGEEQAAAYVPPIRGAATFPNLKEWRASAPERALAKERLEKETKAREDAKAKETVKSKKAAAEEVVTELSPEVLENLRTKTGAAAILP
ncbi:hypothetical protein BT96DRAFT_879857 [Gymnopus androsaceus JB14]|uniref:Ribosomal protein/NADH dehydrogenase domain-containing protein n=1 Tax=Gymnopus androsaceus JB14 TaxID=1447944 RepID=A0A6A4HUY5_9AGAR|nr:hypothetical protein BT96DRAFT_879857 [Gymnopus androsaceus JB14]